MRLERLETLLWERIDGVINAEDQMELEAFLAEDDEAQELEHELTALAKRLASVREAIPPPVLRKRINEALAAAHGPMAGRRALMSAVGRPSPIRWAPQVLAMAASLLIGVGVGYLLHVGGGRPLDESRATGAIYVSSAGVTPVAWEMVLGQGAGTLEARRTGANVSVELRVTGEHRAELRLDAEDGDLRVIGVKREAGGRDEIVADAGRVIVHTAGSGSIGLELACSDDAAPVFVVVSVDGEDVAERWIGPAGGAGGS
jgi:hypothetical protein